MLRGPLSADAPTSIADIIGPVDSTYHVAGNGNVLPGGSNTWPEASFQPGLQQSYSAGRRPRLTDEQLRDGSVIDASQGSDLAQAEFAHRITQGDNEEPHRLGGHVPTGLVRPTGTEPGGTSAVSSGHARTVRAKKAPALLRRALSVTTDNVPGEEHTVPRDGVQDGWLPVAVTHTLVMPARRLSAQRPVSEGDRKIVTQYRPQNVSEAKWMLVGGFVQEVVLDNLQHSGQVNVRKFMSTVSPYVAWSHLVAGRELTREAILDHELIAYYFETVVSTSTSSRASGRASLLRMADFLVPERVRTVRVPRYPRLSPAAPYTAAELRMVCAWPMEQGTAYRRHTAASVVAFVLGAALRHVELRNLRREDVWTDADGVLVKVSGTHERVVPVMGGYERQCALLADAVRPGSYVLRPDSPGSSRLYAAPSRSSLLTAAGFRISISRMRTTWLLGQLNRGVPPSVVQRATGLRDATELDRYTAWIEAAHRGTFLAELRQASRERNSEYRRDYQQYRRVSQTQQAQQQLVRDNFRKNK